MKYSVIFLVDEESEDFSGFFDMIYGLFEKQGEDFEVLVVANGTESFITSRLNSKNRPKKLKVMSFPRKVPQPVCMKAALTECSGAEILTLGPSQELTTSSYEKLLHSMADGVDLVVPYRKSRKDPLLNRFHSRMLNKAIKWMLEVKVNDIGCNVKLCRREVLDGLELYGSMFNYLPVLAVQKGFRVKEIECDQFDRVEKAKLYRFRQYVNRFSDLANLFFGTHFTRKPLRFFNLAGACFVGAGVLLLTYVLVQRALFNVPVGERPLLVIGTISLVGGAQLASFGLLGEIISFVHGRSRKEYTIEKII